MVSGYEIVWGLGAFKEWRVVRDDLLIYFPSYIFIECFP